MMRRFVARCTKLATLLLVLVLLGPTAAPSTAGRAPSSGSLVPPATGLPDGFTRLAEGNRDLATTAAAFPDPTAAASRLAAWGWREHTYYTYQIAGTDPVDIDVSVQRFTDGPAAAAALLDLAHARMTASELAPVAMARLGEQSWALGGTTPAGNEIVVGVQQGEALITAWAVSTSGDPLDQAIAAATMTLSQLGTTEAAAGAMLFARPDSAPLGQLGSCSVFSFATSQWQGGFLRDDSVFYGRPWVAVYGARSDFPQASVTFALDTVPAGKPRFVVEGLDDEAAGKNPIAVFVNGSQIYNGDSPFAGWDGSGRGENAPWTPVTVVIPEGLLVVGLNRITFANLSPVANFSSPPYILLSDAVLTV